MTRTRSLISFTRKVNPLRIPLAIWRPRPAASKTNLGGEAFYVLVHTPYLRPHHNWKTRFPSIAGDYLEKLKRTGGMQDIESRIIFERALSADIHDRYHVLNGAIPSASHGRFLGAFRPGNRSPDLRAAVSRRRLGSSRGGDADGVNGRLDAANALDIRWCGQPSKTKSQFQPVEVAA